MPWGSGVLWDPSMGDDVGSSIEQKDDGRVHHTVFDRSDSPGGRYSWDDHPDGKTDDPHFTDQGYPKNDPRRHPFD
jgi:hypothetical protein